MINAYVTAAKEAGVSVNSTIAKRHGGRTGPRTTGHFSASDQVLSITEWLHILKKPTKYLTSLTIVGGHGEKENNGRVMEKVITENCHCVDDDRGAAETMGGSFEPN